MMTPVLLLAALWWWMQGQPEEEEPRPASHGRLMLQPGVGTGRPPVAKEPVGEPTPAPALDDLKRIEGIGPRIAGVLVAAGICTYEQLAGTSVQQLRQALRGAQVRANPSSWPEQARLAADGRWEDLQLLQHQLKGGRRV